MAESYRAIALQSKCYAVNMASSREEAISIMKQTIERLAKQIGASIAFVGRDVALVVLPEYFLTGFPMGESIEQWRQKACIEVDGEIYELLGKIASQNRIYLSGNAYELDRNFPELYFQTSFIIAPDGNVILRYRRLYSMFAPTPHDVWDKYLQIYGLEGVFPVAKTEIGNLACVVSEEIVYPEITRCLVMRGAEVICHSSSEAYSLTRTPKDIAKQARAYENMVYVVSANSAGIANIPIPEDSTNGGSKIVDYRGIVIAEAAHGETMSAFAEIDLSALRRYRRRPGLANVLSRQKFELYAPMYAQNSFYPPNTLLEKTPSREHFVETQRSVIEKLSEKGLI
jgi:predicted amidohydrolase